MSKTKIVLKRTGLGLLILAVLLAGGGGFYFKSYLPNTVAPKSFPQIDGTIQLAGLDGPVDIYRDQMGVAHIYASTMHDLMFAEGYVHAQERFWQMDFYRHVGSGRTAEMFGAGSVETDMFLKTLGWERESQREYEEFSPEFKAILDAYASGVNAYIADRSPEELSLEYSILGLLSPAYKIEPWKPLDTMAWAKALSWDLKSNIGDEIQKAVLMKTLTPEQIADLFPPYPKDHPIIVNKIGDGTSASAPDSTAVVDLPDETLAALQRNASLLDGIFGPPSNDKGSNSWAVSGKLTTTGKPLLANDPHLGIAMPSIWYQISLHCAPKTDECPYSAAGYSLPGAPGVLLGHNDNIAWGLTFTEEDVMDLYIEKVNPDNPNQYEVNGKWIDFETRTEVINVVGKDPVEITVRSTRHGPVISDTYGSLKDEGDPDDKEFVPFKDRAGIELPEQYVVTLRWTALTEGNPFEAVWGVNKAENWEQFREALHTFHVPGHNFLYADVEGNIAYQATGDVPIRANGNGSLPVPGWTDEYEWTGFIPFDEMPYTINPAEGYIATANNQIPPNDYPYFITTSWDYGFRANRIVDLIKAAPEKFDIAYLQSMQADAYDASAETFVPLLLQLDAKFAKPNEAIAFDSLKTWDYQARADSQAAAVYAAFWRNLLKNTFDDELPEDYWADGGDRWFEVTRDLRADSAWWDDTSTKDVVETRDDILKKSFSNGVAELEDLLGNDPAKWNWGGIHVSIFRNGSLGESGIPPIEALFNRGPFPTNGGKAIVNNTSWNSIEGYEVTNLPSMRTVYDLSDFANTVSMHTTGQSGHAFHPHYFDMAARWANVEYDLMLWQQDAIIADAEGHLVLTPK
ncbi:MAG: penicillin acylase family protein [Anaerolineales bacterium]|nr:penicillin acylase family protein [Anaerolineales bacterium]